MKRCLTLSLTHPTRAEHIANKDMNIRELTRKVKESASKMTREEKIELLRKANIIDDSGYYSEQFFSAETVANDKAQGKPLVI